MFYKDFDLKFIYLSNFQGASAANIKSMFRFYCSKFLFEMISFIYYFILMIKIYYIFIYLIKSLKAY